MPDLQCDAIRPGRIAVFLSILQVCAGDIDLSILSGNPLVNRVVCGARMNGIFLDDKTFGSSGTVACIVVDLLRQHFRVGQ